MAVVFVELNEVNFDHVRFYAAEGRLPHLSRLIREHGVAETTSESDYDHLEPWIQWVTAHTGLSFAEHRVFRLGDIENRDLLQIWEFLEERGFRVGAISPMNAKNRTKDAAFFVPDPWTPTRLTAPFTLRRLYMAVSQAVNDNAQARITLRSLGWLIQGVARYARPANYARYLSLASAARSKPWVRSMFLDLLLSDVFIGQVRRGRPDFSSLFLNAAAHIQHHYMFNSIAYRGERENPGWYIGAGQDPVAEIYELYDHIIGELLATLPGRRVMIATGLHQDPHPDVTFYWRIKDHAQFLRKLGIPFKRVSARMSRDFVIECDSAADAVVAERILASAQDASGLRLFDVDNRGRDVFVMLTWPHDIAPDFTYTAADSRFQGLRDDVAFVAIKNGEHSGIGYFIDTGLQRVAPERFPLSEMPSRVCDALGVKWSGVDPRSVPTH